MRRRRKDDAALHEQQTLYVPPSPLESWHRAFVWGIFTLALLVRAAYIKQLQSTPLWSDLTVDLGYYHDWALRIAAGDWVGKDLFEQSPLYAYFLAILYKVFGAGLLMPRLIQIVVGSATCVLIYKTGRLVFSPAAGLIAGLMGAIYGPFLFYDGMLMKEVFAVFFMSATIYQLHAGNASQRGLLATAGLTLALAALVRDNTILLAAPIALWLIADAWLRVPEGTRRTAAHALEGLARVAAFGVGMALVLAPVMARNYHVSGELVLLTTGGGEVFYIGNNSQADGRYSPPPFVRAASSVEHEDFRREAARRLGHAVSRQESSKYWLRQGLEWIRANPGDWLALEGRKLLIFWNHYELPDNHSYDHHAKLVPMLQMPLLRFSWLVPLAAAGLVLTLPRWRDLLGLYLIGAGYVGTVLLFFNFGRFRMPAVPVLLLFAGAGLVSFAGAIKRREVLAAVLALAAAAGAAAITSADLEDDPVHIGQMQSQLAELLIRAGRLAQADTASNDALARLEGFFASQGGTLGPAGHGVPAVGMPGRPDLGESFYAVMGEAYQTRAHLASARGDDADAQRWSRLATAATGDRSRTSTAAEVSRRGVQEMEAARFSEAAASFRKALELLPTSGPEADAVERLRLSLQLAQALHRAGRPLEALPVVEQALDQAPGAPAHDRADAHYGEALIHRDLGHREQMLVHFRECLALNPEHPRADWIRRELAGAP